MASTNNEVDVTALSNSKFCANKGDRDHTADKVALAHACRLVLRHALVPDDMKDTKDKVTYNKLPAYLKAKNEEYHQATTLYWPYRGSNTAHVSLGREAIRDELFEAYRKATLNEDPTTKLRVESPDPDMNSFLKVHLEDILDITRKMRRIMRRQKHNPRAVLEAEYRRPFDDLQNLCLEDYWEIDELANTKTGAKRAAAAKAADIKVLTMAERTLNLSGNPIKSTTDPNHAKGIHLRIQQFLEDEHPTQEVHETLLEEFREVQKGKQTLSEEASKRISDWMAFNNKVKVDHQGLGAIWAKEYDITKKATYSKEPRTGICDIVSAISISLPGPLKNSDQHSKHYDFIRLNTEEDDDDDDLSANTHYSKHLQRNISTNYPGDIFGSARFATPAYSAAELFKQDPNAQSSAAAEEEENTEVLIPIITGEMKRHKHKYDVTGGNQLRQYLVSGVKFLATLGARDIMMFGYLTGGNTCNVIGAFTEADDVEVKSMGHSAGQQNKTRDTRRGTVVAQDVIPVERTTRIDKIHILERQSQGFDLASPLGTFHFASFLLWNKYKKAKELQEKFVEGGPLRDNLVRFKTQTPLPTGKQPVEDPLAWTAILQRPGGTTEEK